jgi:hypothetical protein
MRIQSLLYAALNPAMRALLRSPLHGVASRNLGLLCYEGRRSGRRFETPLSYVREGSTIRFLSSRETRWWTNFRAGPTPVEVEIGRKRLAGVARLIEHDSEALRNGVRGFLTALPRDAMVYGIKLDSDRRPRESDLAKDGDHVILVEVQLAASDGGKHDGA